MAPLDPATGDPCHADPRINRRQVTDVYGVMLQVESRPKPDLQDLPVHLGERFAAEAGYAGVPAWSSRTAGGRCGESRDPCERRLPWLALSDSQLLNGSSTEQLAPRNHPGIRQDDEQKRPDDPPRDGIALTTHQEGQDEDEQPE